MPSIARLAALLGGLAFFASVMAADVDAQSYGYPLANPFEATIATTPPELRPELPAALGDVVALALQKHPATRYSSGEQMAEDLRAVLKMLPDAGAPGVDISLA